MKLRLRLLILTGALLLVLFTIAAACGSADELTLGEFLQQVQAASDDFEERGERLVDEFADEFADEPAENEDFLPALKEVFTESNVLREGFLDELGTLNPPSEAEDAFDELLTAGSEMLELLEGFADGIAGAKSFAEVEQLQREGWAAAEAQAIQERYQHACRPMRDLAYANGILFSFGCDIFASSPD